MAIFNTTPDTAQLSSAEISKLNTVVTSIIDEVTVDEDTSFDEDGNVIAVTADSNDTLADIVIDAFDRSEQARLSIENRWLEDLRQFKGIYEQEVVARMNQKRSKAYIRLTRTKVCTVDSRLSDLLFPANGDKNWSILPTPIPEFSEKRTQMILQMVSQEMGEDVTPDKLDMLMMEEAKKQSNKMSKVIEDQLAEIHYREVMRDVIHSGNLYGTGILKGPLVSISQSAQYKKKVTDKNEEWILQEFDAVTPFVEHVHVWDVYPDMDVVTPRDCRYIVQRRKMDKHELNLLGRRSDFNGDTIYNYIVNHPDGDYVRKAYEIELLNMGDVASSASSEGDKQKKYEILEYWGYVDAVELERLGVKVPDNMRGQIEIAANIWVLGKKVIKASLMPIEGVKLPYFFYYYDKDETSIFGEGIPGIMRDVQELINSAFRAMLDNAAMSAGPQLEVNMSLLNEDEDPREFYPFKVWLRTGEGMDAANPAIRAFNIPSNTGEFERMIELFRTYGDEVTAIPRFMWGETTGQGQRTASGMSMLLGSANITLKDQVKNFDDGITKPFITAMYHWNMQFNDNDDVKGDYSVAARGTSSLIAKEVRAQSLISFAQLTGNPNDLSVVKRPSIIRSIAESLDLSDENLVHTDKEIQVMQAESAKAAEEERLWMSEMVEAARAEGVSPSALIDSLRGLRKDMQAMEQQAAQADMQTQQANMQAQPGI